MGPIGAHQIGIEVGDDLSQTGRLRRSTLVSLRWMAVIGQTVALAVVWFGFKFELPLLPCLLFIGLSAGLNILIMLWAPLDRRITNLEAGAQLFVDVLQLSALLYLTGGMENPFVLLLIAPVVVAAKSLNVRVFATLAVTVAVLSFALLFFHLPLPWTAGVEFTLPQFYQYGSWSALLVGMLFTSAYTWRAASQTKRMSRAFAASEAILAHEKKLSALGGFAAAAAHELGTPLATIQVVAKEIARAAPKGSELKDDADLLLSQAGRCRDILQGFGSRGDAGDAVHDRLDLSALIREITQPFVGAGTEIIIKLTPPRDEAEVPILARQPELVYGLTNIVENATDFAKTKVWVQASWDAQKITIKVLDDGPGFAGPVLSKLGEPYISHRPGGAETAGGMGLGLFIAKTLIERLGGSVSFSNRKQGGASVQLCWPYAA